MKKRKKYKSLYTKLLKINTALQLQLSESTDLLWEYRGQMSAYTMSDTVILPQIYKNQELIGE